MEAKTQEHEPGKPDVVGRLREDWLTYLNQKRVEKGGRMVLQQEARVAHRQGLRVAQAHPGYWDRVSRTHELQKGRKAHAYGC